MGISSLLKSLILMFVFMSFDLHSVVSLLNAPHALISKCMCEMSILCVSRAKIIKVIVI